MGRRAVEVEIIFLDILAVVAFGLGQAEETLLEDQVLAESLPFSDNSFDVTMSVTVIEEVDADRMLAEMVRVTKPGAGWRSSPGP